MKTGIKVGDIMTRDFISVSPDTSILECARKMVKKRVGSLILEQDDKLEGLITQGDIIWALTKKSGKGLEDIKAKDIAPKKLITIKPNADLYDALIKMKKSKYRWLPVTIKSKIIGFLTLKDILKIEPALFDIAAETYQIKEESEKFKRRKSGTTFREGICEECTNQDILYKVDGNLICESCRDAM